MRRAVLRNNQRLFFAQLRGEQTEWRNFGGAIHPHFVFRERNQRENVIELRRRGNLRIKLASGINQHRRCVIARGFEQRGEQSVLVLAVAVFVVQHIGGSMRLKSSHSERQADVAKIRRNVVVKRRDLLEISGLRSCQLGCAGANFCRGQAPVLFEAGVPPA